VCAVSVSYPHTQNLYGKQNGFPHLTPHCKIMSLIDKATMRKWIDRDDKVCKAMDRAIEKKDRKLMDGWLKAWEKEDRRDQRHWEKELMDKYRD
jgi:hypothetical protein